MSEARARIKRIIHKSFEGGENPKRALREVYKVVDDDNEWGEGEEYDGDEEDEEEEEDDGEEGGILGAILGLFEDEEDGEEE